MISAFNRRQVLWGILGLAGSVVCYVLAWWFIQRVAMDALQSFHLPTTHATWLSWLVLVIITFSGWRTWKSGQGFQSYSESVFSPDLTCGDETTWARAVDNPGQRARGVAYLLSQLFLSGPLLMLESRQRLKNRIPDEAGLETKLADMMAILRTANRWQGLADYPGKEREILLLGRMKQIDFSQYQGRVRFKASAPD